MNGSEIDYFYFGPAAKRLFGCYHSPQSKFFRECGVVFCHPLGHEYIASHRAYQRLAVRLASAGFHVLRFDFYGCGDSSGDCDQGGVHQWLNDISTAIREVRRRGYVIKVCLLGLRLGGSLAMMAGARRQDIAGVVMWDPVVSGPAYIQELATLHYEVLLNSHARPKRNLKGNKITEVLGFPLSDIMLEDLHNLDLLKIREKPADHSLLIEADDHRSNGQLRTHLQNIAAPVAYQCLPSPTIWIEEMDKVLVPTQILDAVVSWMCEVFS